MKIKNWKRAFDNSEMVFVNQEDQILLTTDIDNDKITISSNSWKGEKIVPFSILFELIQYQGYKISRDEQI